MRDPEGAIKERELHLTSKASEAVAGIYHGVAFFLRRAAGQVCSHANLAQVDVLNGKRPICNLFRKRTPLEGEVVFNSARRECRATMDLDKLCCV